MPAASKLRQQLASLPAQDRAELALYLIESLDPPADADADALWEAELSRRLNEMRRGTVIGEPAEEVMARLQRKHS